jgi:hypothetical protein
MLTSLAQAANSVAAYPRRIATPVLVLYLHLLIIGRYAVVASSRIRNPFVSYFRRDPPCGPQAADWYTLQISLIISVHSRFPAIRTDHVFGNSNELLYLARLW